MTITIVGGGACGIATFLEIYLSLQRHQRLEGVTVHIIEKRKKMAEGLAFGTSQPGHILNTAANLMGIFVNEPGHYGQWIREAERELLHKETDSDEDGRTYAPRRTYGAYLGEQYQTYVEEARSHGLTVEEHFDEAVDLTMEGRQTCIKLGSGAEIMSDAVVLALGTPKPNAFPELQNKENYVDFPWPSSRLIDTVPADAPVGVIGSSLSAIDTLMTLSDNQHTGPITLFSLRGILPKVQLTENTNYERQVFTLSSVHQLMRERGRRPRITELFRLFQQEAELAEGHPIDWKETGRLNRSAYDLLQEDIKSAEEGTDTFQKILYSLRYESSELWSLLDEGEQARFARWLGEYYNITRHCMPLINALRIRQFFEQGQLSVVGKTRTFEYDDAERQFVIKTAEDTHTVPYLVNATGTATKIDQMDMPLMNQLKERSLVVPHPSGGVRANRQTLRLLVPGQASARLYAVGQLLSGELLDTNAVWFNVASVQGMVTDILAPLYERH